TQIRIQALILLRSLALRPTPSSSVWVNSVRPDQQNSIINSLIQSLVLSATPTASSLDPLNQQPSEWIVQIGHTISDLAKNSQQINFTSEPWSIALRPLVIHHLLPDHPSHPSSHPPDPILQTTLLNILTSVPSLFCSSTSELEAILSSSLSSNHFPLRLAALQSICISELDSTTQFSDIVYHSILIHLPDHHNQSETETALDHLIEFLTFNDVHDLLAWIQPLVKIICLRTNPITIRSPALECLVTLIECSAPTPNQLQELPWLEGLLSCLIGLMAEIPEDSEWASRIYTEDDDEDADEMYIQAEQALDRVCQQMMITHENQILPQLFSQAQSFAGLDWRAKQAYLSALAVVIPASQSHSNFNHQIIQILALGFHDSHPRVIYASLYALAQLCGFLMETLKYNPEYQNQIMSCLVHSLDLKDYSKIQNYAAKALTELLLQSTNQAWGQKMIELDHTVFESLFMRLIHLNPTSVNPAGLNGLVAIGSLFGSVSQLIAMRFYDLAIDHFEKTFDRIQALRKPLSERSEQDQTAYDQVQCQFYDAVSEFASNIGEERFDTDSSKWANRMLQSINSDSDEKMRILGYLIRLSNGISPHRFLQDGFLEIVLDNLLKACQSKPDISISALLDQSHEFDDPQWVSVLIGDQTFGIKSHDLEVKDGAAENLLALTRRMGVWLIPYCDRIVDAVIPLLKFYFSDTVREATMALLPVLLRSAKASGMPSEQVSVISTSFCASISEALSSEPDEPGNLSSSLLAAWADCFNQSIPSAGEVDRMIELSQRRLEIVADKERDDQDVDNDDGGEDNKARALTLLSRVLRLMITLRPSWNWQELTFKVVGWVINQEIDQSTELSLGLKRLGFRLIGAFVNAGSSPWGEDLIGRVGKEILSGFDDQDNCLRGLSPFIIGLCAEKSVEESKPIYRELVKSSIGKLVEGLNRREGNEVEKLKIEAIKMARENCLSALAKIIRNSIEGVNIDLNLILDKWIDALPIEIDIEEIEATYGLLLELIARGHELVDPSKNSVERIKRVIGSMVSIIENPKVNSETKNSISVGLKSYLSQVPESIDKQIIIGRNDNS
ncbi:armadillo-type protein, partial [Phakopsora pachyrhizi]